MAEEKHFDATQSRLEQARRRGDVPRSADMSATFTTLISLGALLLLGPHAIAALRVTIIAATRQEFAISAYLILFFCCVCLLFVTACAGVGIGWIISGGMTFTGIKLGFERLMPATNVKRILSRDALITMLKSLIVIIVVGFVLFPIVHETVTYGMAGTPPPMLTMLFFHMSIRVISSILAVGTIFAYIDFSHQRRAWRKRLRMSHQEMKRDIKENQGDPHVRSRRKRAHRGMIRASLARLSEAAFVVTNPTHIAIALAYDPPTIPVPKLVVRAADEIAHLVREQAHALRLPIVENIQLARSLYANAEVDDYIPRDAYVAVAKIVAALYDAGELSS